MATTLVAPQPPAGGETQEQANTSAERTDYIVGWKITQSKNDKDELVTKKEPIFYPVSNDEEIKTVKDLMESGAFKEEYQVTVSIPRAKNYEGIKEICPNEEEAANNFNRGAKQKATNRLKAKLTELNPDDANQLAFSPDGVDEDGKPNLTNGVLDMTEDIASPSKKKVLTEEEKLDRFLKDFPEATRNLMKQAYLASRQAPAVG